MKVYYFFFFKQKTAYEITRGLEFRRVLFRSAGQRERSAVPEDGLDAGVGDVDRLIVRRPGRRVDVERVRRTAVEVLVVGVEGAIGVAAIELRRRPVGEGRR